MQFSKPRRAPDDEQRILPLINVVFLLLIFFMIAGQLAKTDPIKIAPPVSDSESKLGDHRLRVLVASDGRLLAAGEPVAVDDLEQAVRDHLETGGNREVHLKADGQAEARRVVDIMDRLRAGGAEKIRLLTTTRGVP